MNGLGNGRKLNLNVNLGYTELQARQGLLRIAYLGMCTVLGYRFVLSEGGQFARALLAGDDIETIRWLTPRISDVEITNVEYPLVATPIGNDAYYICFARALYERGVTP